MANTDGVPGFPDTFFGPKDKSYMDRLARDHVKLRGVNLFYYKKRDYQQRIDGATPLSDNPNAGPFDPKGRKGTEIAGLYGEPISYGQRINSTIRQVTPAWDYAAPIEMRGVVLSTEKTNKADDRGAIEVNKMKFNFARVMCDDVEVTPMEGDVLKFPDLLDGYFDVERVTTDSHRFGATGFFTAYELDLVKFTKFEPQRKDLPGGP